jgi:hypothetical protein
MFPSQEIRRGGTLLGHLQFFVCGFGIGRVNIIPNIIFNIYGEKHIQSFGRTSRIPMRKVGYN